MIIQLVVKTLGGDADQFESSSRFPWSISRRELPQANLGRIPRLSLR